MHHIIITWTGAEMALGEEMKGEEESGWYVSVLISGQSSVATVLVKLL
jgi:hypothetical protein